MWWLYEKAEETPEKAIYRYARESYDLDGVIEYDKMKEEIIVIRPCKDDNGSNWDIKNAIMKFEGCVVGEGFPQRRKVVIG